MASALEEYFTRILWLNLDRRPDRRRQADDEFDRLKITRHERIAAVDNSENGNAGCTSSHRLLWRRIASGEFGRRPLILEDDFMALTGGLLLAAGYSQESDTWRIFQSVIWKPLFDAPQLVHIGVNERFDEMVDEVPNDFDILYLGGQYQCAPISRVSKHVIRTGGMLGTLAYCMRPKFAAVITEALDRTCPGDIYPGPVDLVLCRFARKELVCEGPDWWKARVSEGLALTDGATDHKFYCLTPRLFIPRPGSWSDLREEYDRGFPHAFVDSNHEVMV